MKNVDKRRIFLLLLLLLILAYLWWRGREETRFSWPAQSTPIAQSTSPSQTGEILVDLADDVEEATVVALAKRFGIELSLNSPHSKTRRLYRAKVLGWSKAKVNTLLAKLRKVPVVEVAERDVIYSIPPLAASVTAFNKDVAPLHKDFPNDPKYQFQWHLDQIKMKQAWKRNQGDGVIVAVIDTGVAYKDYKSGFKRVPDLANTAFVPGYDFVNNREHALDDHGHGTHVAGTIAQSTHNGVGVAGVAFKAKIMPLKVLSARGFGNVADIAEAVRFAADRGAKIINMSLGGPRAAKVLAQAVEYAHKKGVLVVCAAGNDGRGKVGFPAAYPHAFAVAATQFDGTTTFYSNWGKEIAIAAPGGNTRVDQNNDGMPDGVLQNTIKIGKPAENDYLLFMGTSMASPHVAGVAALVASAGVSSPDAIAKILTSTAKHPKKVKRDDRYGSGIIDAAAALGQVKQDWQGEALGVGAALLLIFGLWSRRLGRWTLKGLPGAALGVVFGASGLFFLPALFSGGSSCAAQELLSVGFPSWSTTLFGGGQVSPLLFSALVPLLAAGVLFHFRRLRPWLFGFALGVAAHLMLFALRPALDVAYLPALLEPLFLFANGAVALMLAALIAQSSSADAR